MYLVSSTVIHSRGGGQLRYFLVGFFSEGFWEGENLGVSGLLLLSLPGLGLPKTLWRDWRGLGGPKIQVRWGAEALGSPALSHACF